MGPLEIKLSFLRVSPKEPGGRERGWGAIDEVPHSRKNDVSQKTGSFERRFSPQNTFCSSHSLQDRAVHGNNVFLQDSLYPLNAVVPDEGRPMREAAPGSRRPVSPSCLPHAPRNLAFKNGRMHPAIFRAPIPANNFPHGNRPSDEGAPFRARRCTSGGRETGGPSRAVGAVAQKREQRGSGSQTRACGR